MTPGPDGLWAVPLGAAFGVQAGAVLRRRVWALAVAAALMGGFAVTLPAPMASPPTVRLEAVTQDYRPAGEFRLGTRIVDAPVQPVHLAAFLVMTHHVTEADYAACVADGDCLAAPGQGRADVAQTQVNYADALAYASWLSGRTGLDWRLPTDTEWLRAAGDRGFDDGFAAEANGSDPSRRWIATYRREAARRGAADLDLHPLGYFGINDQGVADIAGNIWEWTETCYQNGTLTPDGSAIVTRSDYCGARAVQGKHRGFVPGFVRDVRTGGCAAGVPPDYLGIRLVRTVVPGA